MKIIARAALLLLPFLVAGATCLARDPKPDVDEAVPPVSGRPEVEQNLEMPDPVEQPPKPSRVQITAGQEDEDSKEPLAGDREGMVYVPAGYFYMSVDATGQRRVKVYVDAFFIDKYAVSNSDYEKFIRAGGYRQRRFWSEDGWKWRTENNTVHPRWWDTGRYNIGPDYPDHPVAAVSWYEAEAYCRWAGKRLPTEAEWEKASRGTDDRLYPWGNHAIRHNGRYYANLFGDADGHRHTAEVAAFPQGKSPYGCYNMVGNVWEWTNDWRAPVSYYRNITEKNPRGLPTGIEKILRGGSWYKSQGFYETSFRLYASPGTRAYDDIGFRCAADVE